MIRKLMASTALLALMSAGAVAQDNTTTTTTQPVQTEQTQAVQPVEGAVTTMQQGESLATRLMGQSVYSSDAQDAERIGEIDDLIVDDSGNVTAAVIGVGGFLGLGEKKVAIEYNRLQVMEPADGRDMRVVLPATKDELIAAAEFQREANQRVASEMNAGQTAGQPAAVDANQQTAATDANQQAAGTDTSTMVVTQPATTDTTQQTAQVEQPAAVDANQQAAGTDTSTMVVTQPAATDTAQTTTTQPAATDTTQQTAQVEQPAAAAEGTQQSTVVVTEPADATQQTAQVEQPAAAGTEQPAVVATTEATTAAPPLNFVQINDPDQMRASNWLGKEVYIGDNESIGEISDIVLTDAGRAESAIIDVGGFLGAGERRVAIPFADIKAGQAAQDGREARLTAAVDRAAIEQLQPYTGSDMAATQPAAGQTTTTVAVDGQAAPAQDGTQTAQTTTTTTTAETAPAATTTQTAETSQGQAVVVQDGTAIQPSADGQMAMANGGMSADRLMGARVYDANNEDIGEIDDVIFTNGGDIRAVVVDVGGFLGIGEKPVAIQYDGLNVQNDKDGELRLIVNATEDQLEEAPAYR